MVAVALRFDQDGLLSTGLAPQDNPHVGRTRQGRTTSVVQLHIHGASHSRSFTFTELHIHGDIPYRVPLLVGGSIG